MRNHLRSESPTPATGIPHPLRSPSPSRLLSASSRAGDTRPWWLKVPQRAGGNPLVRNPLRRSTVSFPKPLKLTTAPIFLAPPALLAPQIS